MGPQTVDLFYNTDLFNVEATIDDVVFDINCQSTSSCKTELSHIPSLKSHELMVKITQKPGTQALKEEDITLVYE